MNHALPSNQNDALNFQFNRRHQQVAYEGSAVFDLRFNRAQLDAALATLQAARTVEQAASLRLDHGLATDRPA
jgi:outer membrane protein TolC